MANDELALGFAALVVGAWIAHRLPKSRLYRQAGYVHADTFAISGGNAPLHQHDDAKSGHIALYRRLSSSERNG